MVENFTSILDDVCDPLTLTNFIKQTSLPRSEATSILEDYVKSKGDPLWALYEISGAVDSSEFTFLPAEAQIIKHVVVPESDLTDTKSKFSEVFSTCLHSIQRTNPKDTRVYGRSWADNDDLKGKKLPEQLKPQKKSDSSNVKVEKEKSTEQKPTIEPSTSSKSAIETKKSSIAPPKKQGTLSMFSKKTEKKTEKAEKSQSPVPQDQEKKNRKRPMIEVDESEELIKATKPKEKTPEKKPEKLIISQDSDEFPSSREQSVEKEKSPPAKRKRVNDENKKAKKRLIVPDSDDEEQVPMEVEEKKTETKKNSSLPEDRRRTTRIEKVVETYVDEDGYLVSKAVQKAVECSPQKASPEKPKPKVITAPAPGTKKAPKKNSMITSFFKKT